MDTPITHLGTLLQAQRVARLRRAFKARLEDFVRAVSDDFGHRPRVEVAITRVSSTMRSTPGCVRGWTKRARQVRGSFPCTRVRMTPPGACLPHRGARCAAIHIHRADARGNLRPGAAGRDVSLFR